MKIEKDFSLPQHRLGAELASIACILLTSALIVASVILLTRFGCQLVAPILELSQQGVPNWVRGRSDHVQIPAGEFIYQDRESRRTGAYNIDATEVTVRQYAEFLAAIGNRTDFDHPAQPRNRAHTNSE